MKASLVMAEKVRRDRQLAALRDMTGALDAEKYPHWATPEATSAWVRAMRRGADAHSMKKARAKDGHDPVSARFQRGD